MEPNYIMGKEANATKFTHNRGTFIRLVFKNSIIAGEEVTFDKELRIPLNMLPYHSRIQYFNTAFTAIPSTTPASMNVLYIHSDIGRGLSIVTASDDSYVTNTLYHPLTIRATNFNYLNPNYDNVKYLDPTLTSIKFWLTNGDGTPITMNNANAGDKIWELNLYLYID